MNTASASGRSILALLHGQQTALEQQNIDLKQKFADAENQNRQLQQQLSALTARQQFVERRGALFKRKSPLGYHECVYCPGCLGPMFSLEDIAPCHCSVCNRTLGITGEQLPSILSLPE